LVIRTLRRTGPRICAAIVATAASCPVGAAEFQVRAYVQPEGRVVADRPVRLTIEVQGETLPRISAPELKGLENLKVVRGPQSSQQSSFQFDGTRSRRAVISSFVYDLLPDKPGPATIPAVAVRIGSQTLRTEPIRLEVVEGTGGPAPPTGREAPRGQAGEESAPVFLRSKLGTSRAWVGQPVTLDLTLYAAVRVRNPGWVSQPTFSQFWVEEVPPDDPYPTTVQDREYVAYPIDRRVLVPTTSGEYEIDPYTIRVEARRPRRDMLEDFFSLGMYQEVVRKSESLRLEVTPLPETDRPDNFSGAVGTFRLSLEADRTAARVNDAIALRATVRGEGFLKAVPAPVLESSPDLKVFDPKASDSLDVADGVLRSRKTWEWLVVPTAPGEVRLPAVRFSYFDPSSGTYRELRQEAEPLIVERGEGPADPGVARGEVRLQRREIAFIKPLRGKLSAARERVHQRPWFWLLMALPLVLAPLVIFTARRRARLSTDLGLARARRARRHARKRLRATERRAADLDSGPFHEEIARALVDYVADRFNRSPAGLTYEIAEELLAGREVPPETRRRFRSCLETCDFARFVPASGEPARRAEVLREAIDIVDLLERELR
jgi:hypothetical protein